MEQPTQNHPVALPAAVGPYRILGKPGQGGMGVVLQGADDGLRRAVAVKLLRPELAASADARERFVREARAVAALDHAHVVPIHFVGEDRGVPYFVMPLLRGESPELVNEIEFADDNRHLFLHNSNSTVYVLRLPEPRAP